MALFYNNTNVATSQNVYLNNQASDQVFYNNTLVWKRDAQVYPGSTWYVRGSKTNETNTAPPTILKEKYLETLLMTRQYMQLLILLHITMLILTIQFTMLVHMRLEWLVLVILTIIV